MEFLKTNKYFILAAVIMIILIAVIFVVFRKISYFSPTANNNTLQETGKMSDSADANWWLNSGGIAYFDQNGHPVGTNEGNLDKNSRWQKLYAKTNSQDTDGGYRPQNIFRLVTRSKWQNESQQMYFYIDNVNLSKSKNRNESNGVLFFNRYQDGDNLYYAGFRVDGDAVIKKKIGGTYYTMAEKNLWTNGKKYAITDNPNLLPLKTWIGLKTEVRNIDDNTVDIKLYIDKSGKGDWQLALETQDKNNQYGDAPFLSPGYGGIRTDFMDVRFKNYSITNLQ